jgi:lipid A 3-O-deacylase
MNMSSQVNKHLSTLGLAAFMGVSSTALATTAMAEETQDYIAVSVAQFDVNDDDDAAELRLEYRGGQDLMWGFSSIAGAMATSDEAIHVFAGVALDFDMGHHFRITPSFAPGYYHDGDGKDLGYGLEFRSQLEISYQFDNQSRLGVSLNHISNAGLGDRNPGTESLALTYAWPLNQEPPN